MKIFKEENNMKMNGGILTGVISVGVVVAGTVVGAFTPAGKKVRKEFTQSIRNVKENLEKKTVKGE